MQPHVMRHGSVLYSMELARRIGVGAALHLQPPKLISAGAAQLGDGVLLCSRKDMDEVCIYDVQSNSLRKVWHLLCALEVDSHIDWTNGNVFPWWV